MIKLNTKIYIDRRSVRIANRSASIPKWLTCEVIVVASIFLTHNMLTFQLRVSRR